MAASTSNLPERDVVIKGVKNKGTRVKGRALAAHWYVTPYLMKNYKHHSKKRNLTHECGLAAVVGVRYKVIAKLWDEIKGLDIHHATAEELKQSPDYEKLGAICKSYKPKKRG